MLNSAVTTLFQSKDGYLWVGTQNGLFRHDGVSFRRYGVNDGLPGSYILAISEGNDGNFWVNTHRGLARMRDGRFFAEYNYAQSADENGMGMVVTPGGVVYVSTPKGILLGKRSGQRFTYYFQFVYLSAELRRKPVGQMIVDDAERAWFGCGTKLCILKPNGKMDVHGEDWGIPAEEWEGILRDPAGRLWLRSREALYISNAQMRNFERATIDAAAQETPHIFSDKRGHVYLATKNGLWVGTLEGGNWRLISQANGLAVGLISHVLVDREDNIWIGMMGDGLLRWLGPEEWEAWTTTEGLNSNTVWSILRDDQQRLWVSTDEGINYLPKGGKKWFSPAGAAGRKLGRVMSMQMERPGVLWATSATAGLIRIDTTTQQYQLIGTPKGLPVRIVYGLLIDSQKRLWIATGSGLFRSSLTQPQEWQVAGLPSLEDSETIYTLRQDSRGRIWASGNFGLQVLSGTTWRRITRSDGLLTNSTWFVNELGPGEIFVGYLDSVGDTTIRWPGREPLLHHAPSDKSNQASQNYFAGLDRSGLQWIGTDQGVRVLDEKTEIRLTDQDGLIWNDCDSNAFFADDDGTVWIGTSRGLAHGHMRRPIGPRQSPLEVASLELDGRLVEAVELDNVSSDPQSLKVWLKPLTFRYGGRLEYLYRLGGEDTPWQSTRETSFEFQRLPPGRHVLQVKARLGGVDWASSLIEIPVNVDYPFWSGMWGRLLQILAAVVAVAIFWRYRNHKLILDRERLGRAVAHRTAEIERLLEKAQESSRLKTEFLANMSHEIRTPMNGILGMLQLTAATSLSPEQREYVHVAKSSADNLLGLLNEILDHSKVEAGYVELFAEPFSLRQLVGEVVALIEPTAMNKGVEMRHAIDEAAPEWVLGDRYRLRQVLLNLLGNAVKFTEKGYISARVEILSNGLTRFEVKDSGIGIPAEKQEMIFDAFRQVDGSTTRRFGGTGLGLSISSRLVKLMGGKIEIESTPGQGSRFFFDLPLPESTAQQAESTVADLHREVAPMQILVAEDNRVNQLLVRRMLERDGHRVQLAEDGAEAVAFAMGQRFDLILMDIHMPNLDGLGATQRIREAEHRSASSPRVPIIALSAGVLPDEQKRCLEAGMDAFLPKPIQIADLRRVLEEFTAPPSQALNQS